MERMKKLYFIVLLGLFSCEVEDIEVCVEETYVEKIGWHRMHHRDCDNTSYHESIKNRFGDKQYDVWSYASDVLKCDPDFFDKFEDGDLISSDAFSHNYLYGGCREITTSASGGVPGCVILEFEYNTRNKCYYAEKS